MPLLMQLRTTSSISPTEGKGTAERYSSKSSEGVSRAPGRAEYGSKHHRQTSSCVGHEHYNTNVTAVHPTIVST